MLERFEISIDQFNRHVPVREGAFMYNANINPYTGDMYHENPLILVATNFLINKMPLAIPYLIISLDLAAGWLLYKMAQRFIREMVSLLIRVPIHLYRMCRTIESILIVRSKKQRINSDRSVSV